MEYRLTLITPTGNSMDITQYVRELSWEEEHDSIAARATAQLQNERLSSGQWLHQSVPLGGHINIAANWGNGFQEVFRGVIFGWNYITDPLGNFTITAYDQLIYLNKSKDDRYYSAGTSARAIIVDIAQAWGIPLGRVQGLTTPMAKQVFRGDTLADMIFSVLEQVKKRGGGEWIVRSSRGQIDIIQPGQNPPLLHLSAETNVATAADNRNIENLVTRVQVIGASDSDTKARVIAQHDGRVEFGILQELVYDRQHDTAAAAQSAALELLKERGKPQRERAVTAMDVPYLRKGDKVTVSAGTLTGELVISQIRHNATTQEMEVKAYD